MSDLSLYTKLSMLPNALKSEISDFMDYLISRKLKSDQNPQKVRKAGFLKGTFTISDDFDDPIDDFKDYM